MVTVRCLEVTCLSKHRFWWFPHLTVPAPPQARSHWLIGCISEAAFVQDSQFTASKRWKAVCLERCWIFMRVCVEEKLEQSWRGHVVCVSYMCACTQFPPPQFEELVTPSIGNSALRQKPHQSWRCLTGSSAAGTGARAGAALKSALLT